MQNTEEDESRQCGASVQWIHKETNTTHQSVSACASAEVTGAAEHKYFCPTHV